MSGRADPGGWRALAAVVRPHLLRLAVAAMLAAGAELAGLALLATATWLLVSAAGQPPLTSLTVAIVSVRAFAIGRGTLRYAERLTGHDAVLRILAAVRERLFTALAAGRAGRYRSGDLLSRIVSDVEAVQDLLLRVLVPAFAAGVLAVAAVGTASLLAAPVAPVVAAGLLCAGGLLPLAGLVTTRRAAARVAPLRARVAGDAVDLTEGAADLAAAGATAAVRQRAAESTSALARLEARLSGAGAALDGAGMLIAGLTAAAVAVVGVRSGIDGVTVAVLTVGTLLAVEASLALLGAARQWTSLREPLARVTTLLAEARLALAPEPAPAPATAPGRVELVGRGLRVQYPDRERPALDGVNLRVLPGARIAVVGPSGAGKSTLLAALAGLCPLAGGTVSVAGRPVTAYHPAVRPRLVGGLFAEAHLFHATVRANLLLGRPEASEPDLHRAVREAGLEPWLREQPDGLDTVVGERGGQLSGGQRQRLALARAMLSAPAVLLLDEPTEGLAPRAATEVLTNLLTGSGDRAVVLATHQLLDLEGLEGLDGVDEVLVLEAGRVTQRGSPHELASVPGWYRDQVSAQRLALAGYRQRAGST